MISIPQADLLNMLPVTQVTPLGGKALDAGSTRFDVALLEAAKMVRDGVPEKPELTLSPKVRAAFEAALGQLSQKPVEQLKTLLAQPQAAQPEVTAVISNAARSLGLNADETAVLKQLVPLALPSVLAFKAQIQVPGTSVDSDRIGGVQPGPQGGTPVKTAAPADPIFNAPESGKQPLPSAAPDDKQPQDAPSSLAAYAQSFNIPVLISTRTDDGSSKQGPLTLSAANGEAAPAAVPPVAPSAPARVLQVLTSQQPEANGPRPAALEPPVPQAPGAGLSTAPVPAPQGSVPQSTALSLEAFESPPSGAPQAPRQQGGPETTTTAAPKALVRDASLPTPAAQQEGAPTPQSSVPNSTPGPQPKAPTLDFQVLDPSQTLPVQAGTEVTLKEDGTWVLPKGDTNAVPSTPLPVGNGVSVPTGVKPMAPTLGLQQPVRSEPMSQPTFAPNSARNDAGPSTASVHADVTPVPAAPLAPAGNAVFSAPVPDAPRSQNDPVVPVATEENAVLAPSLREQAGVVQARRQAEDSGFNSLAQSGQDPLKAMALQAARDFNVRETVFKQVSEALREAPEVESGRLLIRLKPSELGDVTIDLVMTDGKLSARLVASQPEVRDAFVRDLQSFKVGLESQGVVVRDVSVAMRAGVADQQQQPAPQQQQAPWWRNLPQESKTPAVIVPAFSGYTAGATDQRFSAFA